MKKNNESVQVFASDSGGLILKENGDLYACGDNICHRFGIDEDFIPFSTPKLILKNVKHAALSIENLLYIDTYDEVHMLGDNQYSRCFTGFKNAEKVFALGFAFLIKSKDGNMYGFGKNAPFSTEYKRFSGVFQPAVEIPVCDPVTAEIKIHPSFESLAEVHNRHILKFEETIFETMTFSIIRMKYPKKRLFPKLLIESEQLVSTENPTSPNSSDCMQTYSVTYQPIVWYMDEEIYTPVLYTHDGYNQSFCYAGCMFAPFKEQEFAGFKHIKKAASIHLTDIMLLTDNTLHVITGKDKSLLYMTEVEDISAFGNLILVSKTNGQVLYGTDKSSILLKKSLFKKELNHQLEEIILPE